MPQLQSKKWHVFMAHCVNRNINIFTLTSLTYLSLSLHKVPLEILCVHDTVISTFFNDKNNCRQSTRRLWKPTVSYQSTIFKAIFHRQ